MKYLLFVLLVLITTSTHTPKYHREVKFETYFDYYKERKEQLRDLEFSYDRLREYLILRNVPNREIIVAQAMLETGLFMSSIFYENNNLFGMKLPKVRETTAIGENRGHAVYSDWVNSVDDYILWYKYVTRNKVYIDYLQFLSDIGYAEDPEYLIKLLILKNSYNT